MFSWFDLVKLLEVQRKKKKMHATCFDAHPLPPAPQPVLDTGDIVDIPGENCKGSISEAGHPWDCATQWY